MFYLIKIERSVWARALWEEKGARTLGRKGRTLGRKDHRTSSQNQSILELELKNTSKKSMPTYNEVLTQVQRLALTDQLRLLEELRKIIHQGVEVEGDDDVISAEEIAESQAALADYFAGRDRGISSKELKLKLFGEKSD
ncbi:hypothetical protein [Microcoleus sp. N9_A1]|uniref:hypothetical protein n=1 Tax=Microcoleus sp. N9_A1 TaxID=3055380 RepID=UPI002FD684A1